jgi:porin
MPRTGLLAVVLAITSAATAVAQDVSAGNWNDEAQNSSVVATTSTISEDSSCNALSQNTGTACCTCGNAGCGHYDLRTREHLTNGFWGLQPAFAEHGIVYDAELTQFYQGVANGGFEQTFKYGGKFDQFFIFKGEKLGFRKGAELTMHVETRFGEDVIGAATSLDPVNINMLFPSLNNDTAITGLQFLQPLNENFAFTIGRINTLDLFQALYPQTGRGIDGFMNTSIFLPLTVGTTIPLVFNGGGFLKLREEKIEGGLLVLDPRNVPTISGFDDMFSNGASIVGLWRIFSELRGKPGSHLFVGSWASGDFRFVDNPWPIIPDVAVTTSPPQTGSWSLLYILEQQLWVDGCNPKRNVGLLSQWGYSDPETNLYEWVGNVSLQANGMIRGREADSMGIGWFYSGLNSKIKNDLSPALELRDLTGVEAYYNAEISPWFHLTTDLQVVEPAVRNVASTAFLFGLRAKITF